MCCPVSATLPRYAVAKIIGNINDQEFGISVLTANISRMAQGTRISADLHGVPTEIGQEFFFFLHQKCIIMNHSFFLLEVYKQRL